MRIGLIGGVERTESQYVRLAAEAGHQMQFHGGHMQGRGAETLTRLVDACDVVVILTDVNSHGAVQLARRKLRQRGRTPLLLRRLGRARFEALLAALSARKEHRSDTMRHATSRLLVLSVFLLAAPGVAAAQATDDKPTVAVTYDKGLLFTSSDDKFELKLALRSQFRFEAIRPLDPDAGPGEEFHNHFSINRLRLQLEGFLYEKALTYKLEFGLEEKGNTFTKDFFIDKAWNDVHVRLGQWKRPFNRQELVADFSSTFNERANTNDFLNGGRDLGAALHNNYEKSPEGLEWVVGVFNTANGAKDRPTATTTCTQDPVTLAITCTTGAPTNVPDDFGPAIVARVGWNVGKIKGYSEGDLEGGPLRIAVAANYRVDLADLAGDAMSHAVGADVLLKVQGFDFIGGVVLVITKKDVAGDRDKQLGAYGQAGWFLTPKKLQAAARFAFRPAISDPDEKELEIRGALNWYFQGHAWKIATDAGFVTETTDGAKGRVELRSMAQLTF